jgi:luciferase family oxidoreductase group 1
MSIKLSILEQSTLPESATAATAIADTLAIAREADRLGFHRLWLSEHHNLPILQGSAPEVLLASIGAQTSRIRIGSGGVMLPNHSAFRIAENFRMLEALYPGRVDCGVGRAGGGDRYSQALLNPAPGAGGDFANQVVQLEQFFHDEIEQAIAMPAVDMAPPMWLLSAGGHANSGRLAAERGMGLAVALFINPDATVDAVQQYRKHFVASREFSEPRVMIAINVVSAPDEARLQTLKKASDYFRLMRDGGRYPHSVPSPQTLENVHFSAEQVSYLAQISNREVVGLPDDARNRILERANRYQADEVMLTTMTHDIADKLETYRLLAEAFAL